jgi:hypothetical protein
MLFWFPPMNLPLIKLPLFNSKESATAAEATRHIAKTNPNFCLQFIMICPGYRFELICFFRGARRFCAGTLLLSRLVAIKIPSGGEKQPGRS